MGRLFISATHKSSGKTTISLGVAAALAARGLSVQTFKKGPDYIDPMWLARASGRACYNLDFNTQSEAEILGAFRRAARGADIALIEGSKGLHDGLDPEGREFLRFPRRPPARPRRARRRHRGHDAGNRAAGSRLCGVRSARGYPRRDPQQSRPRAAGSQASSGARALHRHSRARSDRPQRRAEGRGTTPRADDAGRERRCSAHDRAHARRRPARDRHRSLDRRRGRRGERERTHAARGLPRSGLVHRGRARRGVRILLRR